MYYSGCFVLAASNLGVSTITSKGQIVIPAAMREKKGLNSGGLVAIIDFGDWLEVRPLRDVLAKIDFEAERKKTREALKRFAEKHNLKARKVRELSPEEREALAIESFG